VGYRQDYKFMIVGTKAALESVVLFIEDKVTAPKNGDVLDDDYNYLHSDVSWFTYFYTNMQWLKHEDSKHTDRYALLFEDTNIKAYGAFDSIINTLIEVAHDLKCQTQYAHVGDELSDMIIKGESDDVFIGISRNIYEPEW
jgi:hypothetical protein